MAMADAAVARCYTSPTLVLLAMDRAAGVACADVLGFAIRRAPGGETDAPTIFPGSADLSRDSTGCNGETLLEITGSPASARTCRAEFMRLSEHDLARATWNESTGKGQGAAEAFTPTTTRDGRVRSADDAGTPEVLARTRLARDPGARPARKGTPS